MRIHIFLIDADGCVYNQVYYQLLENVIAKFSDFLVKCGSNPNYIASLHDYNLILNFIRKTDYKALLNAIDEDEDEETTAEIAATNRYISYLNHIDRSLMSEIAIKANQVLLDFVREKINDDRIDGFLFAFLTKRQSKRLDMHCSRVNASGSIYQDLSYIQHKLAEEFPHKKIAIQPYITADNLTGKRRGYAYEKIISGEPRTEKHIDSVYDDSKFSIVYGIAQDAYHFYQNDLQIENPPADPLIITMDAIDDEPLDDLYGFLKANNEFLIEQQSIQAFIYNGESKPLLTYSITGKGLADPDYRENLVRLANCCHPCYENQGKQIDVVNHPNLNFFIQQWRRLPASQPYKNQNKQLLFSGPSNSINQQKPADGQDLAIGCRCVLI